MTPAVGVAVAAITPEQAEADTAAAFVRLASDARLRHQMGQAGRARVAAHFRWSTLIASLAAHVAALTDVLIDGDVPAVEALAEPPALVAA